MGIVTINNDLYNKPNPPTIYRPISHNFVQSVSVQITDENGDEISFGADSYVALEILIRKSRWISSSSKKFHHYEWGPNKPSAIS